MKADPQPISRICIFPGHLRMSGAVRVMLSLAEAFVERGVEVDLFLTHPPGSLAYMLPPGVNVTVARGSNIRSLPALVRYLRARRPDALLPAHQADNVVAVIAHAIARVPTKIVVTVHNNQSSRPDATRLRLFLLKHAMRVAYRRAHAIVAVSNGVAKDIARLLALRESAITVIYNPVITPRLLEATSDPVQHPWLLSQDVPVVLGVGRLTVQKDLATLIRAIAIVRSEMPIRLLILGEGEDRAILENLVRDLGLDETVQLPGLVPNAIAYMKRAALLVLSSRWEGLPTVLVEALAVGTPVISTDCPSGPREVLEGGRYGELVPVADVEALARSVVRVLHSTPPRDALMARGRWFSAERAVSEYIELLAPSTEGLGGRHPYLTLDAAGDSGQTD